MSLGWWWGASPFGNGSSDVGWVFWAILLGIPAIPVVGFIYVFFNSSIKRILLKNPKYIEKNQEKFFIIDSTAAILKRGMFPGADTELISKNGVIIYKPGKWHAKKEETVACKFSEIAKICIEKEDRWIRFLYGPTYNILIWRRDTATPGLPIEYELPDYAQQFFPIGLKAAQEIERQVNEHIASRKKK